MRKIVTLGFCGRTIRAGEMTVGEYILFVRDAEAFFTQCLWEFNGEDSAPLPEEYREPYLTAILPPHRQKPPQKTGEKDPKKAIITLMGRMMVAIP